MDKRMIIYCAGAIRGDPSFQNFFDKIRMVASKYGDIRTEKSPIQGILYNFTKPRREDSKDQVYARDIKRWLGESDALIAEYSGASTGTGFEICYATRVKRIPALCLYNNKSLPSLIIDQDDSKYTFSQRYFDEVDLEKFVTCFLEIVSKFDKIDEIKLIYNVISKEIMELNLSLQEISSRVKTFGQISPEYPKIQKEIKLEANEIYVVRPEHSEIDFKDSKSFTEFMLRNIVLQKGWEHLKSQRIGTTFASGRKFKIITVLANFEGPTNLLDIYNKAGEDELSYTQKAFTKNMRAYRRIGLLLAPSVKPGPTKFKDRHVVLRTLQGSLKLTSSKSRREVVKSIITTTNHFNHLSSFIRKFDAGSLVDLLRESRKMSWYDKIGAGARNIDKISVDTLLGKEWANQMVKDLHAQTMRFWQKKFSSYRPGFYSPRQPDSR